MTEAAPEPRTPDDGAAEVDVDGVAPAAPSDAPPPGRRPSGAAIAWLVLLALLGAGVLIGPSVGGADLLVNPDTAAADAVQASFSRLPGQSLVLVAMDADLGTYPEIRATTRAALADVLARGASVAVVSVSVEGRAIAAAELERLRRAGVAEDRLLDLGFVAGAEAGMVRLVDGALRPGMGGPIASLMAQRSSGGIGAFDLILLVGGSDIGPRSLVEQVGIRLPTTVAMVAIAPTFAQPELAPYLRTGQLAGLLATIRDDATYAQRVPGAAVGGIDATGDALPSAFALRIGMLVALIVLLRQLAGVLPRLRSGVGAAEAVDE